MSGTEIDIEWVRRIALETRSQIAADAQSSTQTFRDTTVSAAHVGTLPISQHYASQVAAAHAFFVETIDGVLADLDDFATNLQASADAHETNDGNAAAALTAFDTSYQEHSYQSAAENQESAANDDLIVSEEAEAAAAAASADDGGVTDTGPGPGADSGPAEPAQDSGTNVDGFGGDGP